VSEEVETMSVPSTGARLCLLIAVLLGVWTVYLMTAPIEVQGNKLQRFDCGSVLQGPKSNFARGICGKVDDEQKAKATAAGVATVVVAVGGFLVFGLTTRPRRPRAEGVSGPGRLRGRSSTEPDEGSDPKVADVPAEEPTDPQAEEPGAVTRSEE